MRLDSSHCLSAALSEVFRLGLTPPAGLTVESKPQDLVPDCDEKAPALLIRFGHQ